MREYDIALKSVIRRLSGDALKVLTGFAIERWHNVELPKVGTLRADMVGETADGSLIHVELQSTNNAEMALRMAEYALAINRQLGRFPRQIVLYVGKARLSTPDSLQAESLAFRFRMVDIRELDGAPLLASGSTDQSIVAILMRLGDERAAVRRILRRISESEPGQRDLALKELTVLAGLRGLGETIDEERKTMPILDDIMDRDLLGPALRRGQRSIVIPQIEKRFGSVPEWARQRLEAMGGHEVEETALRLLDARSLEDLLGK